MNTAKSSLLMIQHFFVFSALKLTNTLPIWSLKFCTPNSLSIERVSFFIWDKALSNATEATGKAVEEAAKDAKNAAKDALNKAADATQDAADKMKDAAK